MGLFSSIVRELYSVAVDDRNTYFMEERKVVKVAFFPPKIITAGYCHKRQ